MSQMSLFRDQNMEVSFTVEEPAIGKDPLQWEGKYIFWFTESSAKYNTTWLHMSHVLEVTKIQKIKQGKVIDENYAVKVQTDTGHRTFHTDNKKLKKKLHNKATTLAKIDEILFSGSFAGEESKYIHIRGLIESSSDPVIL